MQLTLVITALDVTGAAIGQVQTKLGGLQTATANTGATMDRAGGQTVGFVDKIGRIAAGVMVAVVAMGAMNLVLGSLVGETIKYDAALGKIMGLTGATAAETAVLSNHMLNLARTLPISPTEQASAAYFILSSGIKDTSEATLVLDTSVRAAAAGLGTANDVADVLTSTLNAYNLPASEAARITDTLVAAVIEGKAEAEEFGPAIAKVIPIAALLGISFEEVAANLATATRAGYDVDLAATGLRQTLINLLAPSTQTKDALAELGISSDYLRDSIREKGLLKTLEDLMDRTEGNIEVLDKIIPNVRGLAETLATAGVQGEAYNQILRSLENSTGSLDKAFQAASQTMEFKMGVAGNKLRLMMMDIGGTILPPLIGALETLIRVLGEHPEIIYAVIAAFAAWKIAAITAAVMSLVVALGPAGLVGILGLAIGLLLAYGSQLPILNSLLDNSYAAQRNLNERLEEAANLYARNQLSAKQLKDEGILALSAALFDLAGGLRNVNEQLGEAELYGGRFADALEWVDAEAAKLVIRMQISGASLEEIMQALAAAGIDMSGKMVHKALLPMRIAFEETGEQVAVRLRNMADAAEDALGRRMPKSMEELTLEADAAWVKFKAGIEDSKDAIESILPAAEDTFEQWENQLERMITAYVGFEGNLRYIYQNMQQANVANADAILAVIAEKGPVYTAMFVELFATNPQRALELLGQFGPAVMGVNLDAIAQTVLNYTPAFFNAGIAIGHSLLVGVSAELGQLSNIVNAALATLGAEAPAIPTFIPPLIEGMGAATGAANKLTTANLAVLESLKALRDEITGVAEEALGKLQTKIDYYTDAIANLEDAMVQAEDQTADWKDEVDRLEKAIGDAEDAIDSFAGATITGETAMEDALFNLGIEMDKLKLKIIKLEEQKLLAKGPDQIDAVDHAIESLEDELDTLGNKADKLEIEKRLKFDPLHRQIEKLVDITPELDFSEIIAGIETQQALLPELNSQLTDANTQYETWSAYLEAVNEALDIHEEALDDTQAAYDALADNLDALDPALKAVVETLGQDAVKSLNDAWEAMLTGQTTAYDASLQKVYDLFDDIKTATDESGQTAIVQPFLDAISGATQVLEDGLATFPGIIEGAQPEIALASTKTAAELINSFVAALWTSKPQLADAMSIFISAAEQTGNPLASAAGFDAAHALVAMFVSQLGQTGQTDGAIALAQMWEAFERASTGQASTTGVNSAIALTGGIVDKVDTEAQPTIDTVERTMSVAMTTLTNSAGIWGQSIGGYLMSGIYQSFLDNWEDYAEDIGEIITQGLQDALGAHSPATAMIPLGVAAAQGYALGFERTLSAIPSPVDVSEAGRLALPAGQAAPIIVNLYHNGTLMGNEIEADMFTRMIAARLIRQMRETHT